MERYVVQENHQEETSLTKPKESDAAEDTHRHNNFEKITKLTRYRSKNNLTYEWNRRSERVGSCSIKYPEPPSSTIVGSEPSLLLTSNQNLDIEEVALIVALNPAPGRLW